jgi:hypothetical protein
MIRDLRFHCTIGRWVGQLQGLSLLHRLSSSVVVVVIASVVTVG